MCATTPTVIDDTCLILSGLIENLVIFSACSGVSCSFGFLCVMSFLKVHLSLCVSVCVCACGCVRAGASFPFGFKGII